MSRVKTLDKSLSLPVRILIQANRDDYQELVAKLDQLHKYLMSQNAEGKT